jgi:D-aminoacyl-tRNA deacylase
MIAFLQRVSEARVHVGSNLVGEIGGGLLVLLCAEREDTLKQSEELLVKLVNYRVFGDDNGKMNQSLLQLAEIGKPQTAGLLLVPQFTLAADTRSGTRPSFSPAAEPTLGKTLFDAFVRQARALGSSGLQVQTGEFGAHMRVSLINDGPVSFWLQTRKNVTK